MRKGWLIVVALILVTGFASVVSSEIGLEVAPKFLTKYLGEEGAVYYDKPVIQTDFTLSLPYGFYIDPWWSFAPHSDLGSEGDDEIDLFVGWSGELYGFSIDAGAAYFDQWEICHTPRGDMVQVFAKVSKEDLWKIGANSISPYVAVKHHIPAKGSDPEGGTFYIVGAKHVWEASENVGVEQGLSALYDTGVYGYEKGANIRYDAGLNYSFSETFSATFPYLILSAPVYKADDRGTEVVGGGGIKVSF